MRSVMGRDPSPLTQWRKWRRPVKSIVMPCSSAAAITSSSRTEPPGWITAAALGLGRRALADDRERGRVEIGLIQALREQAAEHAAVLRQPSGQRAPVAGHLEHAALLLRARELLERVGGVGGREE